MVESRKQGSRLRGIARKTGIPLKLENDNTESSRDAAIFPTGCEIVIREKEGDIMTGWRSGVLLVGMALLCGCDGSSGGGRTQNQQPPQTPNYKQNITQTSAWMSTQQLSDGAILNTSSEIEPYFANLAAIGWLVDSTKYSQVEAWMQWYINHLNPDGTIYDYNVSNGTETSTGTYDSADSYAATFLSLAEALWSTGDSGAQTFIQNLGESNFTLIANVITGLQQSNGLVFAMSSYQVEYLMDNSEDYRGLSDFATLAMQAWNDTATTTAYQTYATNIQNGIQNTLFIPGSGLYYTSAGAAAPNLSTWYPDSVAQLWPIVNGVISPTSAQAQTLYKQFNNAWHGWPQLSFNSQDSFPWCVVGYAGYLMNDTDNTEGYLDSIQTKYVNATPPFPYPFYDAEGGWFMRTNAGMEAQH